MNFFSSLNFRRFIGKMLSLGNDANKTLNENASNYAVDDIDTRNVKKRKI